MRVDSSRLKIESINLTLLRGPAGCGKTTKLREMLDKHNAEHGGPTKGDEIILAGTWATPKSLQRTIDRGAKHLFLDEADEEQVLALSRANPGVVIVAALRA